MDPNNYDSYMYLDCSTLDNTELDILPVPMPNAVLNQEAQPQMVEPQIPQQEPESADGNELALPEPAAETPSLDYPSHQDLFPIQNPQPLVGVGGVNGEAQLEMVEPLILEQEPDSAAANEVVLPEAAAEEAVPPSELALVVYRGVGLDGNNHHKETEDDHHQQVSGAVGGGSDEDGDGRAAKRRRGQLGKNIAIMPPPSPSLGLYEVPVTYHLVPEQMAEIVTANPPPPAPEVGCDRDVAHDMGHRENGNGLQLLAEALSEGSTKRPRGRPRKNPPPMQRPGLGQGQPRQRINRSDFTLPEGWREETKVRENGSSSRGHIDRYYIEVATRHRCRSRVEVMAYLAKRQNNQNNEGA